jgi:hypothetical protein
LDQHAHDKSETLPDGDLLDGAEEVSEYLKKKGLKKIGRRGVYHYKGALGLINLDGRLIGSKNRLEKILTGGAA